MYHYPHWTDEEAELQRGSVIYIRSHRSQMAELGFKYRQWDPEPVLPTTRLHNHGNDADRGSLKGWRNEGRWAE